LYATLDLQPRSRVPRGRSATELGAAIAVVVTAVRRRDDEDGHDDRNTAVRHRDGTRGDT
jgi:hypothetical protein